MAKIGPDDTFKLEIVAALFLFKNSIVIIDEKIYKYEQTPIKINEIKTK